MPDTNTTPLTDLTANLNAGKPQVDSAGNPFIFGGATAPSSTSDINNALNSGQDKAMGDLSGNPTTDINQLRTTAQDRIDSATSNLKTDQANYTTATTGGNDLRTEATTNYANAGIDDAMKAVTDAQKEYNDAELSVQRNPIDLDNKLSGGGLKSFASNQNTKDQQTLSINKLAASLKLSAAQSMLSSKMDVFREFNSVDEKQQAAQITAISAQTGVDRDNLTAGVTLLNQARQEAQNNDTQARQMMVQLATNVPGIFGSLSDTDKQAITQGQVTPTILAAIGKAATIQQDRLAVQQQNADTANQRMLIAESNMLGSVVAGLNGANPGQPTISGLKEQAQVNLENARANALGGSGASVDGQTTAQSLANSVTDYNLIPPALQGFFQTKKDSLGNTYLDSKVTAKNSRAFTDAYAKYWKENSSASYMPNTQPQSADVFDPAKVASLMTINLSKGQSWGDVRAGMMSQGVPLSIYQKAVKANLTSEGAVPAGTK